MFASLFIPLFVLLLVQASNADEQQQKALKSTKTPEPDPIVTASVKSIFSSLSDWRSTTNPAVEAACCGGACPLGLCNNFYTPAPPLNTARTITAAPALETEGCCTAGCGDGLCQRGRIPWRPHVPFPAGQCADPRDCETPWTHQNYVSTVTWGADGCGDRFCGAPAGRSVEKLTTIYPTKSTSPDPRRTPTHISVTTTTVGDDLAPAYHAEEIAGHDQDTLPIIVLGASQEPITLLADIDLALAENYISSALLEALGMSAASSQARQLAAIAESHRVAALGTPAFQATLHGNVSLDFLTGPKTALRQFADVNFNVFDLPPPSGDGLVVWRPELFLGVTFLREAGALRLADDFAGNAALEGLPVLVRDMEGYDFSSSGDKPGDSKQEDWEKDEL